jgi:hypothetical protein
MHEKDREARAVPCRVCAPRLSQRQPTAVSKISFRTPARVKVYNTGTRATVLAPQRRERQHGMGNDTSEPVNRRVCVWVTQLKEGLQINLRGRGRVGQVEVTEHFRVHSAEEADDLAVLLEEDLGAPPLEEGWIRDVAQSIAVGGHGQHHEDSLDLQFRRK